MARKKVRNIHELNTEINKLLKQVLNDRNSFTAEEIKRTQSDMVEKEVYSKYTPSNGEPYRYERRGTEGGLADMRNMWHEAVEARGKVSMLITNLTEGNPEDNENNLKQGQVAMLVEGGDGAMGLNYYYKSNRTDTAYKYLQPRPFQKATIEELKANKMHVQTLALELRQKGIDTKML